MKKKKLSELNLDKCIYMSVGPHAREDSNVNEEFEDIILRKNAELKSGWSLWADSRPPIIRVGEVFNQEDNVYALMCNNGKPIESKGIEAKYYIDMCNNDDEIKAIPEGIHAIYAGKGGPSYALLVEDYYEIDEQDNVFNKGAYNRIVKDGKNCYFNGFELLEKKSVNIKNTDKIICYVAKLRYPYCVKIAKDKDCLK